MCYFYFASIRRHTRCALVTGVQTCALPISKSYDNTIPLFAPRATLRKLIASIVTDSRAPGEAKDADSSNVFQLYQAFASADETAAMRREFEQGIGWGDAKQRLFERIDSEVAPLRERYETLMAEPQKIERRSEEHTSELQSLMSISYAVFCLKKKINVNTSVKI